MSGPATDIDPAEGFRRALQVALHRRGDPGLAPLVDALAATRCVAIDPAETGSLPANGHGALDEVLAGLSCDRDLDAAIRTLAPTVHWYRILAGAPVEPALEQGLLVGRPEIVDDAPARLGLFLILPGVHYPLHQHGALEVYHVVAGRITIHHGCGGAAFELGPDEHSITPSNRLHSLTTGDAPCLIAYCWAGDLAAPGWWWAEAEAGWQRTRWNREPSGRWYPVATETVGEAAWQEVGGPG